MLDGKDDTARAAQPADAPAVGERTALLRRSATRGLAGLLAIVLVVVLEGVRRRGEAPATTTATPAAAPRPSPPPTAATLSPSPPRAVGAEGRTGSSLEFVFEHGLRSGTLALFVDDEQVLEQELSSQFAGKVLGFTRRRGRFEQTVAIAPGRHRIRIDVTWPGKQRSSTAIGTFKEGASRRLVVKLGGITKSLWVEWR